MALYRLSNGLVSGAQPSWLFGANGAISQFTPHLYPLPWDGRGGRYSLAF